MPLRTHVRSLLPFLQIISESTAVVANHLADITGVACGRLLKGHFILTAATPASLRREAYSSLFPRLSELQAAPQKAVSAFDNDRQDSLVVGCNAVFCRGTFSRFLPSRANLVSQDHKGHLPNVAQPRSKHQVKAPRLDE